MRKALIILFLVLPLWALAQADADQWLPSAPTRYTFIKYDENNISKQNKLDPFLNKLVALHATRKGRVTIIHIGDSHLQADGITSVLRNGFQVFFGDAGRGLVFPYQVANTNAPHDIGSSSSSQWKSNRLTSPASPIKTGISGYGIHSAGKEPSINIQLKEIDGKQEHFNKMVFFLCSDSTSCHVTDSNLAAPLSFTVQNVDNEPLSITSTTMLTGFGLTATSTAEHNDYAFYGVSLEKQDTAGILYHSIGVNGARLDQFLQDDLFWKQLKALNGDLFIISLGTNEAQNPYINEPALIAICDSFTHMVRKIAPNAVVMFTTPAGSYFKKRKPNAALENVTAAFKKYCEGNGLPYWNLYHISNGKTGTVAWKKYNLLSHDLIHYNNAGYQLQGQLLLNAFAKAYNTYSKTHPYKPEPVNIVMPIKISKKIQTKVPASLPASAKQPGVKKNVEEVPSPPIPPHKSKIVVDYSN